jgi:hypothetical protein
MYANHHALLERDVEGIRSFLAEFEPPSNGEAREVIVGASGQTLSIRNFPLPDGLNPDYVDIALLLPDYPARPPVGVYLLKRNNEAVVRQLKAVFNVFDKGFHDAPTIPGFQWVCLVYDDNRWRYNAANVATGDNLRKFMIRFFALAQSGVR